MTSEFLEGSPLSFPLDPKEELSHWLSSLHLSQYASSFAQAGYHTLADCRGLTEEKILKVAHFPTGHRRRILNSLEVLTLVADDKDVSEQTQKTRKPVPFPRTIFKDRISVTPALASQMGNTGEEQHLAETQSIFDRKGSLGGPLTDSSTLLHTQPQSQSKIASSYSSPELWHGSKDSGSYSSLSLPTSSSAKPGTKEGSSLEFGNEGFQGEMVDNEIYESATIFTAAGPKFTQSYKLRHRPVPEIPEHTMPPSLDW